MWRGLLMSADELPGNAQDAAAGEMESDFLWSWAKEYTDEDLTRFFDACDSLEKALFSSFLLTGLREQEMVHLTWSDLNFKLRTLRVTANPQISFYPKRWEEREFRFPSN